MDRPRPNEMPNEFVKWQFVMWTPGLLTKDAEQKAIALLIPLLEDVVRLRTGCYALQHVPREMVETVVSELNEHCEDIHMAIVWCYQQLQRLDGITFLPVMRNA